MEMTRRTWLGTMLAALATLPLLGLLRRRAAPRKAWINHSWV